MKITLINYTENPEKTVSQAARLCYSAKSIADIACSMDKKTQGSLIKKIMKLGHYSVLEHVSFSFGIENVSRVCTHQLVRHRIASFSQRSQRYVKYNDPKNYIVPTTINNNEKAKSIYHEALINNFNLYQELISAGIPAEDARYILPQAVFTSIIFTANARELLHFFKLRCCNRAQWEIREVAVEMLKLAKEIAPVIFESAGPPCLTGKCPEGEMSCGKPWKRMSNN